MIKKILLYINSTFDQRDYQRFGIDRIKANGFEIEIWDFFPYLYPHAYEKLKHTIQRPRPEQRIFRTLQEVRKGFSSITSNDFVLFLFLLNSESDAFYRLYSETSKPYGILSANIFPTGNSLNLQGIISKLRAISWPQLSAALRSRNPLIGLGVRDPALIIAGGKESVPACYLNKPHIRLLWTHTIDYDLFLQNKGPAPVPGPYAVFLDSCLPFHPELLFSGLHPIVTANIYYPALRAFFDRLEDQLKVQIVIAAHPRSNYDPKESLFGNRTVLRGKTAELVQHSQFVLNHLSTSANFAVIYNKPIFFISTNQMEASSEMANLLMMAHHFEKRPINIENSWDVQEFKQLSVDPRIYGRFKESFIKRESSPDIPMWQLFAETMKSWN